MILKMNFLFIFSHINRVLYYGQKQQIQNSRILLKKEKLWQCLPINGQTVLDNLVSLEILKSQTSVQEIYSQAQHYKNFTIVCLYTKRL